VVADEKAIVYRHDLNFTNASRVSRKYITSYVLNLNKWERSVDETSETALIGDECTTRASFDR
jgi:hypothetical protein